MRKFLLSTILILTSFLGFGQCPNEILILANQAEVDNFSANYPGCTMLDKSLWVGTNAGSDITNLNGLSQITHIGMSQGGFGGGLFIIDSPLLTSLNGLNNLQIIGGSLGIQNTSIINMQGLNSLEEVRGSLSQNNNNLIVNMNGLESLTGLRRIEFTDLPALVNLEGLELLELIDGDVQLSNISNFSSFQGLNNITAIKRALRVINCDNLTNLDVLDNITYLGYLHLFENANLSSIQGLSNALPENVYLQIIIRDNPSLPDCAIQMICDNFDNPDPLVEVIIENNAGGCNSNEEVMDACLLSVSDRDTRVSVSLFPNPVSSTLQIHTSEGIVLQKAVVYSILGEELIFTSEETVDFSKLSTGIYFVEVLTDRGSVTKKIVKE
jgi:Secretion system C-terminal sorting domain